MKKIIISILLLCSVSLQAKKIYTTFDILPMHSANLAFSINGIVDSVEADIAMNVKKGSILATLDHADMIAKLKIATIAMEHAHSDYKRQQSIESVVQKSKLDLYKFQYNNAVAQVEYIQSLIDKSVLKAPFDGVISAKNIEVGDMFNTLSSKSAFVLQSEHRRKLIVKFDQKYWSSVEMGNAFEYYIDGDNQAHHGVISKIYPSADTGNRKISAEVYADDLIVGLFGTGYIITQDQESK